MHRRFRSLARVCTLVGAAAAVSSHAITVDRYVVPAGGGTSRSARFSVTGSAGQAVATTPPSVGARFAGRAGYWSQIVRWFNSVPVAYSATVTVRATSATAVVLNAVDDDGSPLTFRIVSNPAFGALTGTGINRVYTPGAGFTTGDQFTFAVSDGTSESAPATLQLLRTRVVGRWVFYNQSSWDGNAVAADARDDAALASNKSALLPGVKAGFANYTSFSRGLNGIMVDVAGLPLGSSLSVSDFVFRTGNNNTVSGWATAPAPLASGGVTVRRGAGVGNSDRITLVWGSDAVAKRWLQVRVKATTPTGLLADDVFYFGNAIGETGNSPGTNALVNSTDEIRTRANPRSALSPAPVTFDYDFNRDRQVNSTDQIIARFNITTPLSALQLITPSAASSAALASTPASPEEVGIAADSGVSRLNGNATREGGGKRVGYGATLAQAASVGSPDGVAAENPLTVLVLSDGSLVLHARTSEGVAPRLEYASELGQWLPAPYAAESYREGEWYWFVGASDADAGRFFRMAESVSSSVSRQP
jgi:hypothetical protein